MDLEQLEKLNELKEKGILSDAEFEAKKKELLSEQTETLTQATDPNDKDRTLWEYFVLCITQKYACASGRARRKEYWSFTLFNILIGFAIGFVFGFLYGATGNPSFVEVGDAVTGLFNLFLLIPSFGVLIRRLHDVNMSGWWILTIIVPIVVVFFKSDMTGNKYGPVPAGVK